MKNKVADITPLNNITDENKIENRVFARTLCRQITENETKQVSASAKSNENGRWYFTDTKRVRGWDWQPN